MTREQACGYISFCVDDAMQLRSTDDMPATARLVGWQCGFEPLFVAVWSRLPDLRVSDLSAEIIAAAMLEGRGWFADGPTPPDYII